MVAALAAVALVSGGGALLALRARCEAEEGTAGGGQFLLTDLHQRLAPTGNPGAPDSVTKK